MGLAFTKLFARLFSKKEMRILMASPRSLRSSCWQPERQHQLPAVLWQIPGSAELPAAQTVHSCYGSTTASFLHRARRESRAFAHLAMNTT